MINLNIKQPTSKSFFNIQNLVALSFTFCGEGDRKSKTSLNKSHIELLKELSHKHSISPYLYKTKLLLVDTLYCFTPVKRSWGIEVVRTLNKYTLLVADLDNLHSSFTDWDDCYEYCLLRYPGAIVTRSPSNKVKVYFLVETDNFEPDTKTFKTDRTEALLALLDDERLPVDNKSNTSYKVFMTYDIAMDFKEQINKLEYMGTISSLLKTKENLEEIKDPEKKKIIKKEKLKKVLIDDPQITDLVSRRYRKEFKSFLGFLLSIPHLNDGTAIPVERLSHLSGASTKTVYSYIKLLLEAGLMEYLKEDYRYSRGEARIAKLQGKLLELYQASARSATADYSPILASIKDGNWHTPLFQLTNYFTREEDYLAVCREITGIDKKDRYKQAQKAWKRHILLDQKKI